MKIVVTGHKGFIGSYLYSALDNAIGIDIKDGNDILSCELPDADVVFHLAAQSKVVNSVEDPMHDAKVNILGTIRIAERYKNAKIIYTSSAGAIQEKISSPYGLSKRVGEEYLNLLHKNAVICRLPNVVGKGGAGVIEVFKGPGKNVIYGDGMQTRDFVHVKDIVRGLLLAIEWDKGMYEMGSGKTMTVLEIAEAVGKPYEFAPAREGELLESRCANTTPNWEPEIDIMDYIRSSEE